MLALADVISEAIYRSVPPDEIGTMMMGLGTVAGMIAKISGNPDDAMDAMCSIAAGVIEGRIEVE